MPHSQYILHCQTCMSDLRRISEGGPVEQDDNGNYVWDLSNFVCNCHDLEHIDWVVYDVITKTDVLTSEHIDLHKHEQLFAHIPVMLVVPVDHNSAQEISRARATVTTMLDSMIRRDHIRNFRIMSAIGVSETAETDC